VIGGKDGGHLDNDSSIVEEIDFLKRNIVNLASMNHPRSNSQAFMVNDSIYVFGGSKKESPIGEKYTLSENRWREVNPKTLQGSD
jgi:hypothetical protein